MSSCPDWNKAPAGDDWSGRFWCDACEEDWGVTYLNSSSDILAWYNSGWSCNCIDPDGYLKMTPECEPSE